MDDELEGDLSSPEWLDEYQDTPAKVDLPEPDDDYAYAAARLFSWYPVVNVRGATYEPDDFDKELCDTLLGKQVNLEHDKTKVVGHVFKYVKHADGIDIGIRIDRDQASLQNLDLDAMRAGNYFSRCSVELTGDPDNSFFYAFDDGMNVKKRIPVRTGRRQGIRRTTQIDPDYRLQGMKVAQKIKPKRFTGLGIVHNPADKTSALYAVRASEDAEDALDDTELFLDVLPEDLAVIEAEHEEAKDGAKPLTPGGDYADPGWQPDKRPRYTLKDKAHTIAAARFFGNPKYRAKYSPEHIKAIDAKIAAAKKRFGVGDHETASTAIGEPPNMSTMDAEKVNAKLAELEKAVALLSAEKETASADNASLKAENASLKSENETLAARAAELEKELASAQDKVSQYEKEVAAAEAAKRVDEILAELHGIHPIEEDERESLKERAAAYCTADGVVHPITELTQERTIKALEAKIAAIAPSTDESAEAEAQAKAEAEAAAATKAAAEKEAAEKEKASSFAPEDDERLSLADQVLPSTYRGQDVKVLREF